MAKALRAIFEVSEIVLGLIKLVKREKYLRRKKMECWGECQGKKQTSLSYSYLQKRDRHSLCQRHVFCYNGDDLLITFLLLSSVRKVALSWKCSQTSSLIDQRCHLSIISKCVSIPRLFVDVDRRYLRCRPTLAHTHAPSLCLSGSLLFPPFFPFDIKTLFPDCLGIIEIQDSVVFGCSHFIGSTNTKLLPSVTLPPC